LSRDQCQGKAAFHISERNQEAFSFAAHFSRRLEASFTAGLRRVITQRTGLLACQAACEWLQAAWSE
jgi:hypothetical protein